MLKLSCFSVLKDKLISGQDFKCDFIYQPKKGQVVLLNTLLCIIEDIELSAIGYREFHIMYVDSRVRRVVPKHELSPVEGLYLKDIPEMAWDTVIALPAEPSEVKQHQENITRHASVSSEQLDEIAAERLSKNTEQQTRWAVNIFRGNYKIFFKIYNIFFSMLQMDFLPKTARSYHVSLPMNRFDKY